MRSWSHQCLCSTWRAYTDRRRELSTFPLGPWCQRLVGRDCQTSERPYEAFLASSQLIGGGGGGGGSGGGSDHGAALIGSWWLTERHGWEGGHSQSARTIDVSIRTSYVDGFYPLGSIPSERPVTAKDVADAGLTARNEVGLLRLASWRDYYRLRRLPDSSPAALLLTYPLTLYHAIVEYGQVPCTVARTMLQRPLRIHIVGAEKELNFLDLFREVSFLLPPDFMLELVFVVRGDMLPPSLRQSHPAKFTVDLTRTLRASIVSGTYGASLDPHFDCGSGPPDLVAAFNAGLRAYPTWRSAVAYLDRHRGVVAVCTDYNEHSAAQCASLGGAASRNTVAVNPFRQPRAMPVSSMNLPQFSNGFLYVFNPQTLD